MLALLVAFSLNQVLLCHNSFPYLNGTIRFNFGKVILQVTWMKLAQRDRMCHEVQDQQRSLDFPGLIASTIRRTHLAMKLLQARQNLISFHSCAHRNTSCPSRSVTSAHVAWAVG